MVLQIPTAFIVSIIFSSALTAAALLWQYLDFKGYHRILTIENNLHYTDSIYERNIYYMYEKHVLDLLQKDFFDKNLFLYFTDCMRPQPSQRWIERVVFNKLGIIMSHGTIKKSSKLVWPHWLE